MSPSLRAFGTCPNSDFLQNSHVPDPRITFCIKKEDLLAELNEKKTLRDGRKDVVLV